MGNYAFLQNGEGKNTTNSPTEAGTWKVVEVEVVMYGKNNK